MTDGWRKPHMPRSGPSSYLTPAQEARRQKAMTIFGYLAAAMFALVLAVAVSGCWLAKG